MVKPKNLKDVMPTKSVEQQKRDIIIAYRYDGAKLLIDKELFINTERDIDYALQPLFFKMFGVPIENEGLQKIHRQKKKWPSWVVKG